MVEAVMLVALGFFGAGLLALLLVPALSRRADRLARRRAELTFPLSVAEIAADRDHLRATTALALREMEQKLDAARAARAEAMGLLGRRDMTIGGHEREIAAQSARIGELDRRLAETAAALDRALVERDAAAERASATAESLASCEAALLQREAELAALKNDREAARLAQVETGTRLMVVESERGAALDRLAQAQEKLRRIEAEFGAATLARDGEKRRADALAVRVREAEQALAVLHKASEQAGSSGSAGPAAPVETGEGTMSAGIRQGDDDATLRREIAALRREVRDGRATPTRDAALRGEIARIADRLLAQEPRRAAAE